MVCFRARPLSEYVDLLSLYGFLHVDTAFCLCEKQDGDRRASGTVVSLASRGKEGAMHAVSCTSSPFTVNTP